MLLGYLRSISDHVWQTKTMITMRLLMNHKIELIRHIKSVKKNNQGPEDEDHQPTYSISLKDLGDLREPCQKAAHSI